LRLIVEGCSTADAERNAMRSDTAETRNACRTDVRRRRARDSAGVTKLDQAFVRISLRRTSIMADSAPSWRAIA
jgi:hypothetical protein